MDKNILLKIASLLVAVSLSVAFYVHASWYPSCCDTRQYVEMARHFDAHGVVANAPHADVRTFGYPWFLSLVSRAARVVGLPFMTAVFVTQLVLYFGCVIVLARRMTASFGPAAGGAVFYGLVFNVLLLPYLPLPMTDGFSVILLLFAAYALLGIAGSDRAIAVARRAAILGVIVGFAVVVRPANLWFGALLLIGAIVVFRTSDTSARVPRALLFVAIAGVAAVTATLPQTHLNWSRARHLSPLPIYDLKTKQVQLGLENIKYATNMTSGKGVSLYYRNPLYSESQGGGTKWYIREPVRGSATVALRLFGGFDFDYLFPYIYDLKPRYRPALFVISQFIVFFGVVGAVLLAAPRLARRVLGGAAADHLVWKAPITASQVFVPAFVAWTAIYGVSAIENRFTFPMVTLLMPVAVATLWALLKARSLFVFAAFFAWMGLAVPLAVILERAKQLP